MLSLMLIGASNLASGLALTLVADNTRSGSGALSFQAFKICSPVPGNGCYASTGASPGAQWFQNNGVVGSTATWDWNATTGVLAATGIFQSTSFVSSNALGSSVISDKTVDLRINTLTMTTTAASYNCVEGTFLAGVGAHGCANVGLGDNFAYDSSVAYNVGGVANCVQRTVGGDDLSTGNPRAIQNAPAAGSCDPVDGGYNLFTVVSDNTATGGNLVLSNQSNIGNCSTVGCIDASAAGVHYMTLAVVPTANDDGPVNARQEVAESINVLANDSGFTNPVTVTVTTPPTKGAAVVVGSPGAQAGISIEYTANAGATGTDTFVYRVLDGNGTTADTATVTITILAFGANDDTASTTRNAAAININVGTNDVGFAEPLTIAITGAPSAGGTATPPAGAVTLANAIISYTPAASAPGTATYTETFTYEVTDNDLLTSSATVTVTVSNTVPVAGPASVNISTTGTAPGSVTGGFNAAALAGNSLGNAPSVVTKTDGTRGTVVVSGTTLTYTPAIDFFSGADTFTYTITDSDPGTPETATGTATVTIPNTTPTVASRSATGNQDTVLNASGAFTAGNGSVAQHVLSVQTQAASGTCVPSVSGANIAVAYTPNAGFTGSDSCVIRLADGEGDGGNGTYSFTVNAVGGGGGGGAALPASSSFDIWGLSLLAGLSWLRRRRLLSAGRSTVIDGNR
jgi:hypothetical protein